MRRDLRHPSTALRAGFKVVPLQSTSGRIQHLICGLFYTRERGFALFAALRFLWKSPTGLSLAILCLLSGRVCVAQDLPSSATNDPYQTTSIVDGRVTLPAQSSPLRLAESNEIPLRLNGYAVHSAEASLSYFGKQGSPGPIQSSSVVAVMHHADGSAYITITPEELGKVEVIVAIDFEDGAFESERMDYSVVLPNRKPQAFYVRESGLSEPNALFTIYLNLSEQDRRSEIEPIARYEGMGRPIRLPVDVAAYKLIYVGNEAPVEFDESTGSITAQNVGHVLIESSFDGLTYLTCVAVQKTQDDGSDRTNCSELVPSGMTPPATPSISEGPRVKPRRR